MMKNDASEYSYLSETEVKEIENIFTRGPDELVTFNKVFIPKQLTNPNAESGEYYIETDDATEASLVRSLKDAKNVKLYGKKMTYATYLDGLKWSLPMKDIENARRFNRPLDFSHIESVARKIQQKMNKVAYVGDADFGVNGIADLTSSMTAITGGNLITLTTPANTLIKAFMGIPAKYRNHYQYKMVTSDAVWQYLVMSGNSYNDKSVKDQVLAAIPQLIDILPESNLESGTATGGGSTVANGVAFFVPYNKDATRMPIGFLPRSHIAEDIVNQVVDGSGESRFGPVELSLPLAYGYVTGLLG